MTTHERHVEDPDGTRGREGRSGRRIALRRYAAVGVLAMAAALIGPAGNQGASACTSGVDIPLCAAASLLDYKDSHKRHDDDDDGVVVETPVPAPPTVVPVPPTLVPDPPTLVPDPPTVVPDPPTVVPDPPTVVPDPPTVVPDPPTRVPDPPTSTRVPPTSQPAPPTGTAVPATGTTAPIVATRTPGPGTRVPSGTPNATGTVVGTRTATPSRTPTGIGTPRASATPKATTAPVIAIAPTARASSGDAGATVAYAHTVTNGSPRAATVNLRATSSEEWTVRLLAADGKTALTDTDDDGLVDVGELERGGSAGITVEVTLPALAVGGTQDVTTVTASVPGTSKTASAKDRTTVNGKLILTIGTTAVGEPSPGSTGSASIEAGAGAPPATGGTAVVTVRITSTGPWTGGCSSQGSQLANEEPGDPLSWRVRGSDGGWTSFTDGTDPSCFSVQEPGNLTYTFEYAAADPSDEEEQSVVIYHVTGDGG